MKTNVSASRIIQSLTLPLWIILVVACKQNRHIEVKELSIKEFHQYNAYDDEDYSGSFDRNEWLAYDSVIFSDGSYAVKQLSSGPQNSLIRYISPDGQMMATISTASEINPQTLFYGYDDKGRLKYLLNYDVLLDTYPEELSTEEDYLHFRLAIDSIEFRDPDLKRHILTEIKYDSDGRVREITEQPSGNSLKAPRNHRIDLKVVPCENFWYSDIDGGRYELKTEIVPLNHSGE